MLASWPASSLAPTTTCCSFGAHCIRSTLWSRRLLRASTIAFGVRRLTRSPSTCARKITSSSRWTSSAQRRRIVGRT
jgi:hypothetical protein